LTVICKMIERDSFLFCGTVFAYTLRDLCDSKTNVNVCVCACVCEREREGEGRGDGIHLQFVWGAVEGVHQYGCDSHGVSVHRLLGSTHATSVGHSIIYAQRN
jgi:hypothetical protein